MEGEGKTGSDRGQTLELEVDGQQFAVRVAVDPVTGYIEDA